MVWSLGIPSLIFCSGSHIAKMKMWVLFSAQMVVNRIGSFCPTGQKCPCCLLPGAALIEAACFLAT